MNGKDYVAWFHNKFRSTYHPAMFPEMIHDHNVLIELVEAFNIKTICEIGTWKGDTALMLYLHPQVKRVKCVDIHKDLGVEFTQSNHSLMNKEEYGVMFRNTFVELVFHDTMTYPKGAEQHDMVFIDACHDYEHVKNDTELALSWNPKIIAWHDYRNGNTGVDQYVDELISNGVNILKSGANPKSCIVAMQAT